MKKFYLIASSIMVSGAMMAQQNYSEYMPTVDSESNQMSHPIQANNDRASWDILLDTDPTAITGGLAGAYWTGTEFWLSAWSDDTLYTADASGNMTSFFVVPGVTGTRSITSDGTSMYVGTAGTSIYEIDPVSKTLLSTISTSVPSCRYCSFDPTLDGGNGGFWTGAYGSDIVAVSMSGTTLTTISAATHGLTGIYGLAYDGTTYGGPYLWAYDQGGSTANIYQLSYTGVPTGIVHDTQSDLAGGNTGIAGGLFATNSYASGQFTIGGLNQGISLFVYDAYDIAGVDQNELTFSVYPNPVIDELTVSIDAVAINQISIYTVDGQLIRTDMTTDKVINVADLTEGVYILQVTTDNGIANQRFVKK